MFALTKVLNVFLNELRLCYGLSCAEAQTQHAEKYHYEVNALRPQVALMEYPRAEQE